MIDKKRFFLAAIIICGTALASGEALADGSCDTLFAKLREQTKRVMNDQKQVAYFLWTTNYAVPEINARFMGVARGQMENHNQLIGSVERTETYYGPYVEVASQPKISKMQVNILDWPTRGQMLLFVNNSGKFTQFGPFDPICFDDKFAIIHSGDSIEVFAFVGSGPPQNFTQPDQ